MYPGGDPGCEGCTRELPQGVGGCVCGLLTLVLLRGVVVVDLLADPLALAQVAGQVLLLLLVVVAEELLPVVRVHALLLLDHLPLHLLLLARRGRGGGRGTEGDILGTFVGLVRQRISLDRMSMNVTSKAWES